MSRYMTLLALLAWPAARADDELRSHQKENELRCRGGELELEARRREIQEAFGESK